MSELGRVENIWRYPVKGMQGEQLTDVFVGFGGVMGDRVYGVINRKGDKGFPWFTARDDEDYLLYRPRYKTEDNKVPENLVDFEGVAPGIHPLYPQSDQFAVEVKSPQGEVFDIESSSFSQHLNEKFDTDLTIHRSSQKSQVDCRPLSILSKETCAQLGDELAMPIDYRRFRPNFLVSWDNGKGFYEDELVGRQLKLGDRCEIAVLERDVRCKMITLDPDTADGTPKILQHVTTEHESYTGVWAAILVEGVVKAGDKISLI